MNIIGFCLLALEAENLILLCYKQAGVFSQDEETILRIILSIDLLPQKCTQIHLNFSCMWCTVWKGFLHASLGSFITVSELKVIGRISVFINIIENKKVS